MSIIVRAKKLVEQITGTHIYRTLPRGVDVFHDIASALPLYRPDIICDVGANVGQSARQFLAKFPRARVYCFEPVSETFGALQLNLKDLERVSCHKTALGSSTSKGKMVLQGSSDMFFLLEQSKESPGNSNVLTESVDLDTLDNFCRTERVDRISYLKIDTEGGDLDVLKGAETLLADQRIDMVQVEAGMNSSNSRHASFESLKAFLESHRYFLFGIYEQVHEWPAGRPHLRRTNPVFMSQRIIETEKNSYSPGA